MTTRRCAKRACHNKQPCPLHHNKQWSNTDYYTPIPASDKAEVIRQAGGICRKCGGAGSQVDHIRNVAEGGLNEMSNYQFLCSVCHKRKTEAEVKRGQERNRKNRG